MNFDGLKDSVIKMLSGESVRVNTTKFLNDIHAISSRDDVLTVLIHLGYLAFDEDTSRCFIPNKEVADELTNAVESTNWTRLAKAISDSYDLLDATLNCNEMAVAQGIEQVHDENVSILSYNDENSLACVLSMAYISAQDDYIIHREYATGKGYADLVFIPRKNVDVPAILMELKCGHSAEKAIAQIKNQSYYSKLAEYSGNIILVGINYDKKTKSHTCKIEKNNGIKRMKNVKVPSSAHEDTFIGLRRYLQEPAKVSSQKRQNFTAINVIVYETNSNRI
ncbi:MAG: PD-(D/E)XK nuclease domain-containing protein [Bacteroidaceae bacterium]|nr:PD-(D/E)XK nuclease domain-containing protein [Bacteroidaceae bacterium]